MNNDKFAIRAKIIEILSKLKASSSISETNIKKTIKLFSALPDKPLLVSTLLKEISLNNTRYDVALALIAKSISPDETKVQIFKILENKRVSDKKKLFLINLLRDLGENLPLDDYEKYMSSPDDMLDMQTELFVKISSVNPEAQIDFLDFFFAINNEDKINLLNSIRDDFKGEELASALEPIVLYDINASYIPTCIDILKNTKSYLAKITLEEIIENNSNWKAEAKAGVSELVISGLREQKSKKDILKDKLQNTIPLGFWSSVVDGANNFTIISARQKADKTIATFFTVINLTRGITSCFGFDDITFDEFKKILNRFFASSYIISLDDNIAMNFISHYVELGKTINSTVPYEFLCWKNYIGDIEFNKIDFENYVSIEFNPVNLNDKRLAQIVDSDILSTWFYTIDDSSEFKDLINSIVSLNSPDIFDIENIIDEFLDKIFDDELLNKKLLLQSYFALKIDMFDVADSLYAIISDKQYKYILKQFIIQKSIYQYFLSKLVKSEDNNVFKMRKKQDDNIDYEYFVKLFEEKWS